MYTKNLSPSAPFLNTNDSLRLGSTFHGLHAIATQIAPVIASKGIEKIETSTFVLQCLQTLTGMIHYFIQSIINSPLISMCNFIFKSYWRSIFPPSLIVPHLLMPSYTECRSEIRHNGKPRNDRSFRPFKRNLCDICRLCSEGKALIKNFCMFS